MTTLNLSCPLCGHRFDPAANGSCASCPLHAGCRLVCCPNCGHTTIDPSSSRLARWASAALARVGFAATTEVAGGSLALGQVRPGAPVRVVGLRGLDEETAARLGAYGLSPGAEVAVIQHSPATVVRVEQTELALERTIARCVLVEPADRA